MQFSGVIILFEGQMNYAIMPISRVKMFFYGYFITFKKYFKQKPAEVNLRKQSPCLCHVVIVRRLSAKYVSLAFERV